VKRSLFRLETGAMPKELLSLFIKNPEVPVERLKADGVGSGEKEPSLIEWPREAGESAQLRRWHAV
jgi:hypothetical protein